MLLKAPTQYATI